MINLSSAIEEPTSRGAQYRTDRYLHLPHFVGAEGVAELLGMTDRSQIRDVVVAGSPAVFGEQGFAPTHPIAQFFGSEGLLRLVLALTGGTAITELKCWTSVYREGQSIAPHRDADGTIQILICLEAPPADVNGGQLVLRPGEPGETTLALNPGDAVVFEASAVTHCTTPMVASASEPQPRRTVVVGRYYVAGA